MKPRTARTSSTPLCHNTHGLSVSACLTELPRSAVGLLSPESAEGEPPSVVPSVSAAGKGSGGSPRGRRDASLLTVPPRPPPRPPPIIPPARSHGEPLGAARLDFKPRVGDSWTPVFPACASFLVNTLALTSFACLQLP